MVMDPTVSWLVLKTCATIMRLSKCPNVCITNCPNIRECLSIRLSGCSVVKTSECPITRFVFFPNVRFVLLATWLDARMSEFPTVQMPQSLVDCSDVRLSDCPNDHLSQTCFSVAYFRPLWLFLLTLSTFCRFDVFSVFKFRHSSIFNSLRLGRFQHSCILSCWSFQFPMLSTFWVSAVFNNLGLRSFHDFELSWCSAL